MTHGSTAMRSIRPGTCGACDSRSATVRAGTSRPAAHAATPSAFATLKRPSSGSATSWLPAVVTSVKRAPFASTRTLRAVTSAGAPSAENEMRRGVVGVDDGEPVGGEVADELCLCRKVRVEGLVVIEMVSRQVREERGAKHEPLDASLRSEEHTSELQSHSFISYAVFCLKKKNNKMTQITSA